MNITALRETLKSRWKFLRRGWSHRGDIATLCDMFDAMPQQELGLKNEILRLKGESAKADHSREVSEAESKLLSTELEKTQNELRELHDKYADLLRRKEAPEERVARDGWHLAKLEIEDLKKRLEAERNEHHRTKGHVNKMWNFIALRHRVDIPMQEGSIRKILQDSQK